MWRRTLHPSDSLPRRVPALGLVFFWFGPYRLLCLYLFCTPWSYDARRAHSTIFAVAFACSLLCSFHAFALPSRPPLLLVLALARVLGPSQLVPFVRGAPLMQRVDLIAPARHAWPVAAGAVRMREQPSRRGRRAVPCLRMLVIGVGSAVSTSVGALMLALVLQIYSFRNSGS